MSLRLAAAILGGAVAGAALGHTRGLRSGMALGYAYGKRDGIREGDENARLDVVLDTPTEAGHYAAVVSAIPGAQDSAAFWEAVRMEGVRRSVQGLEGLS